MSLTILTKSSILDVWLGSKSAIKSFDKSFFYEFNIFSLAVIWLNTFFLLFNFYLFKSDLQVFLYKTFVFISTNIYIKTCTSMQISRCRQDKTEETFIPLIWRKLNMFNFFILKSKRIKSSFFVKYTVILIWSFENDHLKMIVLNWSCILAFRFWCFCKNFIEIMQALVIKVFKSSRIYTLIISFFNRWPIYCFRFVLIYVWHFNQF